VLAGLIALFALAAVAPWLARQVPRAVHWILAGGMAALAAWYATRLPAVSAGRVIRETLVWVPDLGAALSVRLDGLSLLFALLITGLGALIVAYAGPYLEHHPLRGRFFGFLLLFAGAMLGLVLADNIIALFVFWELTSFSSYLLIGFDHERPRARDRALQALLVTGGGGLALLAGLVLLAIMGGSFELSQLATHAETIRTHAWYLPALGLVALGAFTKSAQVPFHFWLPNAMDAPTPVSAYLHSATMVKAGVYLLARLHPTLGGTEAWTLLLTGFGALTALTGAVLALRQTDLKLVLAYSTVSALGTLTLFLGLDAPGAAGAAMTFLLAHALYKGALFLAAGSVDHATGTREATALGGLRKAMPITATGAWIAALSMAGVPLALGFVGKELLYKSALGSGRPGLWTGVVVAAGILTVVAAGIVALRPFLGRRRATPTEPHEAPVAMWLGIVLLGGLGLLLGVAPGLVGPALLSPATAAVLGRETQVYLAAWYGVDPALALSAITLALGAAGYLAWNPIRAGLARGDGVIARGPEHWYGVGLSGLQWLAATQTRLLQNGRLRVYLLVILGVLVLLPGAALLRAGPLPPVRLPEASYYQYVLAAVIVLGAANAALARSRLAAVASVGTVGVVLSVLFVILGAPDLAMTQFLADMLVVVVAILVMRLLPRLGPGERSPAWVHARDWVVALSVGALVTVLLFAVTALPLDRTIPEYYARASVPEGFGRNIVNVILVDFRALDTLGEILVLVLAAIGAHALVRFHRMPPGARPPRPSPILQTTTRFLFTLLVLFSLFLLFRGHDSPGGGFIGGLVAAGAFALYMLAYGADAMRTLLRIPPRILLSLGLLLALASGLVPLFLGAPFLASQWTWLPVGPGGDLAKVGTPLPFDIGVYLVVIGFTLTLVLDFEEA
jgi:multicomponent Na+:H+ antiporter subunit A